jgi:hypothetical protein
MTIGEIDPDILKALRSLTVKEALSRFDNPFGLIVLPSEIKKVMGSYPPPGEAYRFDRECHSMSRIEFLMFITSLT